MLSYCVASGDRSQTVTLRLYKTASGVTYEQTYTLRLVRLAQLKTLALRTDAEELRLCDTDGASCTFRSGVTAYTVTVPRATTSLFVTGTFTGSGYAAEVNDVRCDALTGVETPLDPAQDTETVTIRVTAATALPSPPSTPSPSANRSR